eukprot:jgi/Mesvir1/2801/Mv21138-RA.1
MPSTKVVSRGGASVDSSGTSSPLSHGQRPTPFAINCDIPAETNKNTSWLAYPGIWTSYIIAILFVWGFFFFAVKVSSGQAWTYVHLIHFTITFYLLHWNKGSPVSEDQGVYDKLTLWEQIDHGRQLTRNKKFFTIVPVVTFALASHYTGYDNWYFVVNLITACVLLIAKFPLMYKVRLFGINADYKH